MRRKISSAPAARIIECTVQWVDKLADRGVLPCDLVEVGPGRYMRVFDREDVEKFKQEQDVGKIQNTADGSP